MCILYNPQTAVLHLKHECFQTDAIKKTFLNFFFYFVSSFHFRLLVSIIIVGEMRY